MPKTGRERRTGSAFDIAPIDVPNARMILGVDPGARHNGIAKIVRYRGKWESDIAWKSDPRACLETVREYLAHEGPGALVIEGFQLYPTMLQQQGLSRLGVVEMIGALKWLYLSTSRRHSIAFYEQGASIKSNGYKAMAKLGIEPQGKNIHARDAEAHAWFRATKI
jgi:hypothetical protein